MTARQAAQHIFAGIADLIEENRNNAESAKRAGAYKLAAEYDIAADTLCNVATGLMAAIEEGEYGQ